MEGELYAYHMLVNSLWARARIISGIEKFLNTSKDLSLQQTYQSFVSDPCGSINGAIMSCTLKLVTEVFLIQNTC